MSSPSPAPRTRTVLGLVSFTACAVAFLVSDVHLAQAFDYGHHSSLTASALRSFGFSSTAIDIARLQSFYVNLYSQDKLGTIEPNADIRRDLRLLRGDHLTDSDLVSEYWRQFTLNSRDAFQRAAEDRNPRRVLALLGITLHAVQDFYANSNWVESHTLPENAFLTDTYFDNAEFVRQAKLRNRVVTPPEPVDANAPVVATPNAVPESYADPRWSQAYVSAFIASRQWIAAARNWVEAVPGGRFVWREAMDAGLDCVDRGVLKSELHSAYRISSWSPDLGWKGPGSANPEDLDGYVAGWDGGADSVYLRDFRDDRWYRPLVYGLDAESLRKSRENRENNPDKDAVDRDDDYDLMIPQLDHPFRAVVVRTHRVQELPTDDAAARIDAEGSPDFYARIRVNHQWFLETMQRDDADISPAWTSITFVPLRKESIAIRYELWDEDGAYGSVDDQCDINPIAGQKAIDLKYDMEARTLSGGSITGKHETADTAVVTHGDSPDGKRAEVHFTVTQSELLPYAKER